MVRLFTVFVIFFLLFYFTILAARALSGREAWALTKMLGYSLVCAILAFLTLVGIVIVF